jgi:elongation factor P
MQYLYDAGDEVVFMDQDTYEQTSLPHSVVEDALEFMQPSSSIQMLLVNGEPSGVQLPASVELAVTETEPGVKGDTVSNVTKPATLETGAVIQVPLFVDQGQRIRVDTRSGEYVARA